MRNEPIQMTHSAEKSKRVADCSAATCSPGDFYHGSDGAITCAMCDCEAEVDHCEHCEDGFDGHDCGDDTCCCSWPDENVPCQICYGRGFNYSCLNNDCKALELSRRIEANVQALAPSESESQTKK